MPGRLRKHPLEDRGIEVRQLHQLESRGRVQEVFEDRKERQRQDAAEKAVGDAPRREGQEPARFVIGEHAEDGEDGGRRRESRSPARMRSSRRSASRTTAVAATPLRKAKRKLWTLNPVSRRSARETTREKNTPTGVETRMAMSMDMVRGGDGRGDRHPVRELDKARDKRAHARRAPSPRPRRSKRAVAAYGGARAAHAEQVEGQAESHEEKKHASQ